MIEGLLIIALMLDALLLAVNIMQAHWMETLEQRIAELEKKPTKGE